MGGPPGPDAAAAPVGSLKGWPSLIAQVALAHQPLDRLLQELLEGVLVVHQLLQVLVREEPPAHEGFEDRVVEGLQVVLVPLAPDS